MKLYYGSRACQRSIDQTSFDLIKNLVLMQPGDTQTLNDIIVFDVPRSGIMRPGSALHFQVELGTRGEQISIKAFHRLKTLAKYELRHPLNSTSFNRIELVDEEVTTNHHLLRRDQSAFSDLCVLMDRIQHTVFSIGKQVTYTFQRRWKYPYTAESQTGWFLNQVDYQISVDGEFDEDAALFIATMNLPSTFVQSNRYPFILTSRCFE